MKHFTYILLSILTLGAIGSCQLDNYDGPDAQIHGKIVDKDGNPVQSDATSSGVKIFYYEHGDFMSPVKQSMGLKPDGTYRNIFHREATSLARKGRISLKRATKRSRIEVKQRKSSVTALFDKLELVNLLFLLHPHWQVFVIGLLFQIRPLNQRVQENHHIGPTQRLELY